MIKNTFRQYNKDGKQFNVIALPGMGKFKLKVTNKVGASIERLFTEKYGKAVYGGLHLCEHLSFKSTRDYESDELLAMFKRYGYRNAGTSFDTLDFHFTTTSENIDFAIKSVMNITYNDLTKVSEEEFISEKSVVINEVKQYRDNHQTIFMLNMYDRILNNSSDSNILGTPELLEELTLKDLIELKAVFNNNVDKHFNIIYDPLDMVIDDIINKICSEAKLFENNVVKPSIKLDIEKEYLTPVQIQTGVTKCYPDEAKQSLIGIFVDSAANDVARFLGNQFTRESSNEHSMFNIIRDKHGLTYGVAYSRYNIRDNYGTYFKADVTPGNEKQLLELFKEIVINMPKVYTKEAHDKLLETITLRDKLESTDLMRFQELFETALLDQWEINPIKNELAEDVSKAWALAANAYGTYEQVLSYLEDMANKVKDGDFVIITNAE